MHTTAICSHSGRVRQRNEDASLVLQWEMAGPGANCPVVLAAVADGMGGYANGHIAAVMTVRTLAAEVVGGLSVQPWEQAPGRDVLAAVLQDAIATCAARVNQAIGAGYGPMGSTLAVALVCGRRLLVANVGDSRVYVIRGELKQLTADHSVVAQMVARGELGLGEARTHPRRNELYRAVGFGRPPQPDYFDWELEAGDTILLCSDGLHMMVPDADLSAVLMQDRPLTARCRALIDRANAAGGVDNITGVAVQIAESALPTVDLAEGGTT
ncbi:MAG TPA: protein phosphatase 2C domain-containing protein [Symbiobacteriaceae bacterium]|jgi:protein phosphatase